MILDYNNNNNYKYTYECICVERIVTILDTNKHNAYTHTLAGGHVTGYGTDKVSQSICKHRSYKWSSYVCTRNRISPLPRAYDDRRPLIDTQ